MTSAQLNPNARQGQGQHRQEGGREERRPVQRRRLGVQIVSFEGERNVYLNGWTDLTSLFLSEGAATSTGPDASSATCATRPASKSPRRERASAAATTNAKASSTSSGKSPTTSTTRCGAGLDRFVDWSVTWLLKVGLLSFSLLVRLQEEEVPQGEQRQALGGSALLQRRRRRRRR